MKKIRTSQENEYLEIFKSFDTNGDGKIEKKELQEAFHRMGETLTPAEIDVLLEQFDLNGDEIIDFEELCQMMKALY